MEANLKHLTVQADSDIPLYKQFANQIREMIVDGRLSKGDLLPSERILTEITGASRVTIRKTIEQLTKEGLLLKRQGAGTFIARNIEQSGEELTSFSSETRARGEKPGCIWLMKSLAKASEEEAQHLGLKVDEPVIKLGRVRLSNDEPLAIEHAVIPAYMVSCLDAIQDSLYDALGQNGYKPVDGTQKIRASLASNLESGLLSIPEGSAVLRIERMTELADGTAVEYTRSVYRGDKYSFVTALHLAR